jgi:hypothetical protein
METLRRFTRSRALLLGPLVALLLLTTCVLAFAADSPTGAPEEGAGSGSADPGEAVELPAERLGRELSDAPCFVVDDLGLGKGTGEEIEPKTQPDVVRRVLTCIGALARAAKQGQETKREETVSSVAEARFAAKRVKRSWLRWMPASVRRHD